MSDPVDDEYVPLDCGDYDVLELVCIDRYEVELLLHDGERLVGTPVTLENDGYAEHLLMTLSDGRSHRVRLDRLHTLTVLTRPARLEGFVFGAGGDTRVPPDRSDGAS